MAMEELLGEFLDYGEDPEKVQKSHNKIIVDQAFIDSYISDSKTLVDDAASILLQYQSGELTPIQFKQEIINKVLLGGLFPGTVVGIAGSSGHGKTTLMQGLESDILNESLNPNCKDYMILKNNYEMSVFKLFLRSLKVGLRKKVAHLLSEEFTNEEKILFESIKAQESDPRIKYFENPTDPETWFKVVEQFIVQNSHVKHLVITIDHIALVQSTMAGKKDGIDTMIERINYLKNKYKGRVSFLILSQLNRNIEERDNPKNSAPKKGDLYQSDFLYQLSDVIIVVHQPYRFGLQEHMVVGQDMYSYLNQYKKNRDAKVSTFLTKGNVFYHFIKIREDEDNSIPDLWIEPLTKTVVGPVPTDSPKADFLNKDVFAMSQEVPKMDSTPDIFGAYDQNDDMFDVESPYEN